MDHEKPTLSTGGPERQFCSMNFKLSFYQGLLLDGLGYSISKHFSLWDFRS